MKKSLGLTLPFCSLRHHRGRELSFERAKPIVEKIFLRKTLSFYHHSLIRLNNYSDNIHEDNHRKSSSSERKNSKLDLEPAGWVNPNAANTSTTSNNFNTTTNQSPLNNNQHISNDDLRERITLLIQSFIKKNEKLRSDFNSSRSSLSGNSEENTMVPNLSLYSSSKLDNMTFTICDRIYMLVQRYGEYLSETTIHKVIQHFTFMEHYKFNVLLVFSYLHSIDYGKENDNINSSTKQRKNINLKLSRSYDPLFESYSALSVFENMTSLGRGILNSIRIDETASSSGEQKPFLEHLKSTLDLRTQIMNSFVYHFSRNKGPTRLLYRFISEERAYRIELFHKYSQFYSSNNKAGSISHEIFSENFDIIWDSKTLSSYLMNPTSLEISQRLFDMLVASNTVTRNELSEIIKKYIFEFKAPEKAEHLLLSLRNNPKSNVKPTFEDFALIMVGYINTNQAGKAFLWLKKLLDSSRIRHRSYAKAELANFATMITILIRHSNTANNTALIANITADIFFRSVDSDSSFLLELLQEVRNDRQSTMHLFQFALAFHEHWSKLIKENPNTNHKKSLIDENIEKFLLQQFGTSPHTPMVIDFLNSAKESSTKSTTITSH
ncbi:hypothetical protein FDP41_001231 [Naegleria fowleri]|uniref:Uncharacterized protein n=1 Tax=Naegleria fowleri TaxID=5763 RepID=A0A6A5C2G1_NAEFO|nr:uncharacterized protein FDP41_001231 [Naegleria fowleri]KAF0980078.1 hypothetical protein FDP41_001231 [Naegleria fowleri]CAG4716097.1 unnamed protein product [Naegleria fowleri]